MSTQKVKMNDTYGFGNVTFEKHEVCTVLSEDNVYTLLKRSDNVTLWVPNDKFEVVNEN
jgi:hypothetical protein